MNAKKGEESVDGSAAGDTKMPPLAIGFFLANARNNATWGFFLKLTILIGPTPSPGQKSIVLGVVPNSDAGRSELQSLVDM